VALVVAGNPVFLIGLRRRQARLAQLPSPALEVAPLAFLRVVATAVRRVAAVVAVRDVALVLSLVVATAVEAAAPVLRRSQPDY